MDIDLDRIPADPLPIQITISVVTMAEAAFGPLGVDTEAARAHGRVYAAVRAHGRNPRRRFADLLIAAVALANALPVMTRNATDFGGLEDLIEIVEISDANWVGARRNASTDTLMMC